MANQLKPASTFIASRSALVDKDGMATFAFLKILQDWDTKLRNGLNQIGQLIGEINAATKIEGRTEGIGTTVGHIDDTGVANGPMVDFSRPYVNKSTDHIADGAGNPLAGGTVAHAALVASAPAVGQALYYDGTQWIPFHLDFAGITGTVDASQLPPSGVVAGSYLGGSLQLDSLGRVTFAAHAGLSVTITTAALTVGGTQGSMTFVDGILVNQVQAT